LPALVGLVGFETQVGGFGAFLGFWCDQTFTVKYSSDGGSRHDDGVVVFEVPSDCVGSSV
jgi:hypothetical protein